MGFFMVQFCVNTLVEIISNWVIASAQMQNRAADKITFCDSYIGSFKLGGGSN